MLWTSTNDVFPQLETLMLLRHKQHGVVYGYRFLYLDECDGFPAEYAYEYICNTLPTDTMHYWSSSPNSAEESDITHWMNIPE